MKVCTHDRQTTPSLSVLQQLCETAHFLQQRKSSVVQRTLPFVSTMSSLRREPNAYTSSTNVSVLKAKICSTPIVCKVVDPGNIGWKVVFVCFFDQEAFHIVNLPLL